MGESCYEPPSVFLGDRKGRSHKRLLSIWHSFLTCHSERSEESALCRREILRCAQNDRHSGSSQFYILSQSSKARSIASMSSGESLLFCMAASNTRQRVPGGSGVSGKDKIALCDRMSS